MYATILGFVVSPSSVKLYLLYLFFSGFYSCLCLYHEIEEKGIEIPPQAYGLVIGGLCKEGKCMEGYSLLGL